jgi:hypothetical protein
MTNESRSASWAAGGRRRAVVLKARGIARVTRDRLVDQQLRQLRERIRTVRRGGTDVLYLGESSTFHIDPRDTDRRTLPDMVGDDSGMPITPFWGPGYGPALWGEFIRVLATLEARPRAVVLPMVIRTTALHLRVHPVYAYPQSLARMREVHDADARIRPWGRWTHAAQEDYARFEALPVQTRWGGERTLGDWRQHLRGAKHRLDDVDFRRTLFDYFHGEVIAEDNPGVLAWRRFGEQLRDYGVPVVSYWTPVPLEAGEELFPGEFREQVERNLAVIDRAFLDGAGPVARPMRPDLVPDDEFIEPRDGTEHLNQLGRLRLARGIVSGLRERLSRPAASGPA